MADDNTGDLPPYFIAAPGAPYDPTTAPASDPGQYNGSQPSGPGFDTFPIPGAADQIIRVPEPVIGLDGKPIPGQFTYKYMLVPNAKAAGEGARGAGRNDALTSAMDALNGYLQASSLAEARKKDAFDTFDKVAQYALPPGATTAPGYEPGGPAQAFAAQLGLKQYTPPPITPQTINPGALAQEPAISPQVQAMLGAIQAAGGNAAAQAAAQ